MNKITFLLPTCEPDEMFKWLLPSLHFIEKSKDIINFAICFQPPYTKEQIKEVLNKLDKYNFEYKYFYKDYQIIRPYTPLIKMRNDCALLFPNSLVYGLLDDDMSFINEDVNEQLKLTLETFTKEENIGIVAFKLIYSVHRSNNCFATDRGIFYRGGISYGFEGLMPQNLYDFKNIKDIIPDYNNENILNLFGGYQDKFCAMTRLLNGNEAAIIWTKSINHVENRKVRGAEGHGWGQAQVLEGSIAQFIIKYICKDFLDTHSMSFANEEICNSLQEKYGNIYKFMYFRLFPWEKRTRPFFKVLNDPQGNGW